MFRDAAQLDRQHTASSFEAAMAAYTKQAESWFDGGVGSIDKRLAQCQRLLHAARATTARMDIAHSGRYLKAAESLKADQETLQDLRHALLTGAADREEVTGPPGWKTAKPKRKPLVAPFPNPPAAGDWKDEGLDDYDFYRQEFGDYVPLSDRPSERKFRQPPRRKKSKQVTHIETGHEVERHPETGEILRDYDQWSKRPGTKGLTGEELHWGPPKKVGLSSTDRRWVTLEASRFVSANTDCLDNNHELATRAHHHAAIKTSTFTPQRSARVCEAFVAEVSALGKQMYRPPARTAARSFDAFPDQAIFL